MKNAFLFVWCLLMTAKVTAQPPDKIKRMDTISAGDTICLGDSVTKYEADIIHADGKIVTVRGRTSCITATAFVKPGSRIYINEIVATDRAGNKRRLEKRRYYVK